MIFIVFQHFIKQQLNKSIKIDYHPQRQRYILLVNFNFSIFKKTKHFLQMEWAIPNFKLDSSANSTNFTAFESMPHLAD